MSTIDWLHAYSGLNELNSNLDCTQFVLDFNERCKMWLLQFSVFMNLGWSFVESMLMIVLPVPIIY